MQGGGGGGRGGGGVNHLPLLFCKSVYICVRFTRHEPLHCPGALLREGDEGQCVRHIYVLFSKLLSALGRAFFLLRPNFSKFLSVLGHKRSFFRSSALGMRSNIHPLAQKGCVVSTLGSNFICSR